MKKTIFDLSPNELVIMEVFWKHSQSLSSVDLAEYVTGWKSAYLNNLLSSLQKKGMIKMSGLIFAKKHYTRKFVATCTKEQYAASLVSVLNIEKDLIPKFVMAVAENVSDGSNESIVSELENILSEFKNNEG